MGYMEEYRRTAKLVSVLLVTAALQQWGVPSSSEASLTSLTLQVDNGTPVNILGAAGTCPSGYNQCSRLNYIPVAFGSGSKGFKVFAAPNTLETQAKLLIGDFSSQDAFKLTGVRFGPTSTSSWPNTEVHVLKIVMKNTFDAAPNGSGNYVFALRSGGYLQAGGTVSPLYTQYDYVKFEGKGTFSPTLVNVALLNVAPATTNRTPLQIQVGNAATATYFTLNQVVTYPTFNCDANGSGSGADCKPTITLTMTVTLYGPDSLVLTDSNDALGGGPCNLTSPGPGGPPGGNPAIPCHSNGKGKKDTVEDSVTATFAQLNTVDETTAKSVGAVQAVQCVEADNCPCANPDDPQCAGTIVHIVEVTPATSQTFPFIANGPGIDPPSYAITTNAGGEGRKTFSLLPALNGGPWTFQTGTFPSLPKSSGASWDVDNIDCESALEPKSPVNTTWTIPQGSVKNFVRVDTLKGGDTLTCTWHIHKNSAQ